MDILILAIIIGAMIGSFANAMIYRIPLIMHKEFKEEAREILEIDSESNDFIPGKRSVCIACHQQIPLKYNIPIIGWLLLKGKAACCGASISPRYPFNELIGAVLGAGIYFFTNGHVEPMIFFGILATLTMLLFWIDMDHFLLPDRLLVLWFILWLAGLLYHPTLAPSLSPYFQPLETSISGFFWGFFSLLSINVLFKMYKGFYGMGMGDVKLMALIGLMVGPLMLPYVLIAATFSTLFVMALAKICKREAGNMVPFGPGLLFGGWIVYFAMYHGYLSL